MVTKKGEPTLGSIGVPGHPFHPAGNRSFGNVKTEHKNFSVDARSSPSRVLRRHLANEIPDLFRCPSSPDGLLNFRNHAPVPTESSPVPSDHRFRSDHNQDCFHPADQNACSKVQKALSNIVSLGLGCLRFNAATCWRRAKFSRSSSRRARNTRQIAPSRSANRFIMSCCYRIFLVEEKGVSC